jgi:hypothetical protein
MYTEPIKVKTDEKRTACLSLRVFYIAKLKELRATGKIAESKISPPPRPPPPAAGPCVS